MQTWERCGDWAIPCSLCRLFYRVSSASCRQRGARPLGSDRCNLWVVFADQTLGEFTVSCVPLQALCGVYRAWPGEACRLGQGCSAALEFGVASPPHLLQSSVAGNGSSNRCRSVVQGLGVYTPAEPVMTYEERS